MALDLGVRFTWLGHATFLLTGPDGKKVLVDPWVMNNPSCPEDRRSFDGLDAMLVTHGHFDHVGDAVEVFEAEEPEAVVAMVETAHWLQGQGIPEGVLRPMNKGGTQDVLGMKVTMVHAFHSSGIADGDAMLYGGEPGAYVVEFDNGTRVYHAGDTAVFGDMALIGELYSPDIAMLPIGDHFTMGPREAAKAVELLDVRRVIPMHYATFPLLTGTPDAFREACRDRGLDVDVVVMEPGQTVD